MYDKICDFGDIKATKEDARYSERKEIWHAEMTGPNDWLFQLE